MPFPAMRNAIVSLPNQVFWPKPQDSMSRIVITALGPAVEDHPDRKLCPVRLAEPGCSLAP